MKKLLSIVALAAIVGHATAQTTPFPTIAYLDVNKIKAASLVHGDMWWNPATQTPQCEFPKGSGKNISFASSLWMSGYDAGNNLHVAAQTYRQNGNDYWPGPLDDNADTISWAQSQNWARIWKINRTDITAFLGAASHTATNTPTDILEWPAKGNPYAKGNNGVVLTITNDMAPFVDVNNDGVYNALQGDYPLIKGDQALWWVFNDNGPTHNESKGRPLGVELHAMAYAYNNGTALDNVLFYEYNITNKSANTYSNYRLGQDADMDLGYAFDDYIAFDTVHRMGIVYNGKDTDGVGNAGSYGTAIPIAGVSMIVLPGDNGTSRQPAGSFMYYNNDFSPQGNPYSDTQYNYYLRSTWLDGSHVKNSCSGYGAGANSNYVYTGEPNDTSAMSECKCGNAPGDRRFIITTNDFQLLPGATQTVVMALVTTDPDTGNACPDASFQKVKQIADSAWYAYDSVTSIIPSAVASLTSGMLGLSMYPNPTHDQLTISTDEDNSGAQLTIYNNIGQQMQVFVSGSGTTMHVQTAGLPAGMYHVLYTKGTLRRAGTFIKQ